MSIRIYDNGEMAASSTSIFPGGEVQVKVSQLSSNVFTPIQIHAVIKNSNDLMELLMKTDALRRAMGHNVRDIILAMPYVPYARQDRVMSPGESLSIKVFCDIINSQNYKKVIIKDPHSDVTPALLNNCIILSQAEVLKQNLPFGFKAHTSNETMDRKEAMEAFAARTVLVSPDAGANKKIGDAAKALGISHIVRADKKRDVQTNKILETVVYSDHVGDKDFLIVDDIIDGGRTFIELAKVLRPLTNGKIILYATHGIFSYGLDVFKGVIDEIYCDHSFGKYPENTNLMSLNYA